MSDLVQAVMKAIAEVELAQQAQLEEMRKAATPLAICTAISEGDGGWTPADKLLERLFPGYMYLSTGMRTSARHLFALDEFISFSGGSGRGRLNWGVREDGAYFMIDPPQVQLTDAGRHLVMTRATRPIAYDILAEIEAEEAAEAKCAP